MPNKFIYKHRRGSTAQWNTSDVIPYDGELVIENCDDGLTRFKIGDGVHTYANLSYANLPGYALLTRKINISLPSANWVGSISPYEQVVSISNITANSKIDLQPSATQLTQLQDNETSLVAVNDAGTVTIYAIGEKPTIDYTIQATITETTDS